jgi:hypothetical protein
MGKMGNPGSALPMSPDSPFSPCGDGDPDPGAETKGPWLRESMKARIVTESKGLVERLTVGLGQRTVHLHTMKDP